MDMRFYRCETCGQMVAIVEKKGCPIMCCGKPMQEIIPGTTDASLEKHVPVVSVEGTQGDASQPPLPSRRAKQARTSDARYCVIE